MIVRIAKPPAVGLVGAAMFVLCVVPSAHGGGKPPPSPLAEPLRITNVKPPTPVAGKDVELIIYGDGFVGDEESITVVITHGGKSIQARDVRIQSPHRLKAIVPGHTEKGSASVTVEIVPDPAQPDEKKTATMSDALFFRGEGERFGWKPILYKMSYDWRGFREWFKLGGKLMYVLAALSFFGVAWAVHCLLVLRRSQVLPPKFLDALRSHLGQADVRGAAATCKRSDCAFARIVLGGLAKADEPAEKVHEAIAAAGSREAAHLHQKISYLANIGTISPMLGLLGTVFGMIRAFNIIASGDVRPYLFAAAIGQAMVTTAAGLVIGIPAMALYFYLRGRLLRLTTHMEVVADSIGQTIIERGGGG